MIVQAATLIDPPDVALFTRQELLDVVVRNAATAAAELTVPETAVLDQFDRVWSTGLTCEQLAGLLNDDSTPIVAAELDRIVDRHERAGWLAIAPSHRRTARGRSATVRHITAAGRLVLQQRHASQEVSTR